MFIDFKNLDSLAQEFLNLYEPVLMLHNSFEFLFCLLEKIRYYKKKKNHNDFKVFFQINIVHHCIKAYWVNMILIFKIDDLKLYPTYNKTSCMEA